MRKRLSKTRKSLTILRHCVTNNRVRGILARISKCVSLQEGRIFLMTLSDYEEFLDHENMSMNTIIAYAFTVKDFFLRYDSLTAANLADYKDMMIRRFSAGTVNLRIRALNKYLQFAGKPELKLPGVRVQQRSCLENVISNKEYVRLKGCLSQERNRQLYFCVCYMAMTGVRISELVGIQADDIRNGYIDVYGKGGKYRRVFIPVRLQQETLLWMAEERKVDGYVFRNHSGGRISTRGISLQLQRKALKYGIDPALVHPHAFRHLFAKNFLEQVKDVSLLADLLGHSSIETTRIYLRRTGEEQRAIIDRAVRW